MKPQLPTLGIRLGLRDLAMTSMVAFPRRTSRNMDPGMVMASLMVAVMFAVQRITSHVTAPTRRQPAEYATIVATPGTTERTVQTREWSVSSTEPAKSVASTDTVPETALRSPRRSAECARRKVGITNAYLSCRTCLTNDTQAMLRPIVRSTA